MTRAAPIGAVVLVLAACGGGKVVGSAHTTVQRYDNYPADTISVATTNPQSGACRQDAVGLAREAGSFVGHHGTVYPADLSYVVLRETAADFVTRRCDTKLLGHALVRILSPKQRRALVSEAPRPMAAIMSGALAAVGG